MSSQLQSLKAALIQNAGVEEKVEVNQRHLIDKILARYSAEFTVFRELLQNSNDAGATEVKITFQTNIQSRSFWQGGSKRVVASVTYRNNGRPFSEEDWARLRKIAEGNPDEQKIGFFGVGFYSLFSICEEPFVTSNDKSMAFLWKGDMLYTKKGIVPPEALSPDTCFYLDLRDPVDLYDMDQFGRFIATSLAFTANLKKVEVFVDEQRTLFFDKKMAEPRPLAFPKGVYNLSSPNRIFTLESVAMKTIQMDVEVQPDAEKTLASYRIFMRSASAHLAVRLSTHLVKEMERTTKKRPPVHTEMQIMWSNFDEYESSSTVRGKNGMFNDLLPGPTDQGRIFIGFPTYQTTGCTIQMAAHLIPTVERESIDFVDPTLNTWNQELLSMGGLLARILYDDDLDAIDRLYKALALDSTSEIWLQKKASHTMAGFTFKPSTPSPLVGRILSAYFLSRSTKPLNIVSSRGIKPLIEVRLPDTSMKEFMKEVPIVPDQTMEQCAELFKQLEAKGAIRKLNITDLFRELSSRPFPQSEMVALFRWWLDYRKTNVISSTDVEQLLRSAVFLEPGVNGKEDAVRPLSTIAHYVPKHLIPSDLPLPVTVMPLAISNEFKKEELERGFGFAWSELPLSVWADFIIKLPQFSNDAAFVEKVLAVFSRHYGSLKTQTRDQLVSLLASKKCIPTTLGMQKPSDSYFPKVTLFPDLPIVQFANPKSVSDAFLRALGVREHVELQMVFNRIGTLNWDHVQLIKYLATCTLKPDELERLRITAIFPKEQDPPSRERFRACDLYTPDDKFRAFGLPILEWKGKWKPHGGEAKMMQDLKIRTLIPVPDLVQLAATSTPEKRTSILQHFCQNFKTTYASLYAGSAIKVPFLPTTDPTRLGTPSDCFADPSAAVMGFQVLHPDWRLERDKFGVREHPPANALLERLLQQPPDVDKAQAVFGYLATRISDFTSEHWAILGQKNFVPIQKTQNGRRSTVWVPPRTVYFGGSDSSAYKDHFTYVDFGLNANNFLRACGTREEPTPSELATSLVTNPTQFLDTLGHEKYLELIRNVATHYPTLRTDKGLQSRMRSAAWLIGIVAAGGDEDGAEEDGKVQDQYHVKLARAMDIYIIDDTVVNQLFKPLGAPTDEVLEAMYTDLGSRWLSSVVTTEERPRGNQRFTQVSAELQKLIRQRAPLLLYDGQQMRTGKDVFSNAEQVLLNMKVIEVPEIDIVRTFEKATKVDKTTACLRFESRTKTYWLFVVEDYDCFDIARSIGKVILRNCRLKDSLLLSTLLSTSVQNLRRKGFPVDRILKLTDNKLKNAQVIMQEQARQQQTAVQAAANSPTPPTVPPKNGSTDDMSPTVAEAVRQLQAIFPGADPGFLRREVEARIGSRQPVLDVTEKLLDAGDEYPKANPSEAALNGVPPAGSSQSSQPSSSAPAVDGLFGGFLSKARDKIKNKGLTGLVELAGESLLPPVSTNQHGGYQPIPPGGGGTTMPAEEITPNSTVNLKSHLSNSIASLRGTQEPNFRAEIPLNPPPTPSMLSRQVAAHCSIISDNDLVLRDLIDGVPFYIDRAASPSVIADLNMTGIHQFVMVLSLLANVFGTDKKAIHVYFDATGSTIAFNRNRTLFFNARFYLGLHYKQRHQGVTLPGGFSAPRGVETEDPDTFYYWFLTWCHELGHNFVSEHDAMHEYWMSSFAENYMSKLVKVLREVGVER
ncbi:uncharacterized protein SPPG_02560 [Spizellomyces punctatus DAOM BR117]|uniref:Sacsin/Nov domain-containing protein n=1 Tax=Spizellomyces punctatus (strain DAOM BR117) TaxID=645134 RepID=A0A0L0HKR3_SPIPD|nr:uncharacterized protein SPPG_02560 [Spizellomyces punctatus DAOM BR117]KND02056.1 hypothetical protein SPPG_02560 [Spizellomyces punctatus DAOM BR117]|eukprot:XP_016610095.1 hypothetical protein SPPG_02560 [Spizellomyces punctatus DAOM BR117]